MESDQVAHVLVCVAMSKLIWCVAWYIAIWCNGLVAGGLLCSLKVSVQAYIWPGGSCLVPCSVGLILVCGVVASVLV
jgi:hypothetical protein